MVRQRWLKITNGQGVVGSPTKNLFGNSNPLPAVVVPETKVDTRKMLHHTKANSPSVDIFQLVQSYQKQAKEMCSPIVKVDKQMDLSLDSLTCDEDLFQHRPTPNEPTMTKKGDLKMEPMTPSNSYNILRENNCELVDFNFCMQTSNLENDLMREIFLDF